MLFRSNFSLSFTIKTRQQSNGEVPIISTKNWLRQENRGWGLALNKMGGISIVTGDRSRAKELHSKIIINDGLKHHIRLSFNDELKLVSMEIDGFEQGSIQRFKKRGVQSSPYPLTVGGGNKTGQGNLNFFKGTISDLVFYSNKQ